MTRKVSTNGRVRRSGGAASAMGSGSDSGINPPTSGPHRPAAHTDHAGKPLGELVSRDDGWLRIVPDSDTGQVYIKWKYTRGRHARHYVMAVVQYWQMGYGLELLLDKLAAVADGSLKPSLDTPYPGG